MEIEAKQRLKLTAADSASDASKEAKKSRVNQIDKQIDNKQEQITNLKKNMPSRQNRMKVSPESKIETQKQVLDRKKDIADLRLKRMQTKNAQGE